MMLKMLTCNVFLYKIIDNRVLSSCRHVSHLRQCIKEKISYEIQDI